MQKNPAIIVIGICAIIVIPNFAGTFNSRAEEMDQSYDPSNGVLAWHNYNWQKNGDHGFSLEGGPSGRFDSDGVLKSSIMIIGDYLKLWYTGKDSAGTFDIGLATTTDTLFWTKSSPDCNFCHASGTWYGDSVRDPAVININPNTYLFFTGISNGVTGIGYATSMDNGNSWTYRNQILWTAQGTWKSNEIHVGSVIFDSANNQYMLYYSGFDGTNWRIGLATSQDGDIWTDYPNNPIFTPGASGKFDDTHVYSPFVLFNMGLPKMWYTGASAIGSQIGYATSNDGITWTRQNDGNPVQSKTTNTYDVNAALDPCVWEIGNGYYKMIYTGVDALNVNRLLLAESNNGGSYWEEFVSNGPIRYDTGAPGQFDYWTVRDPSILWEDNHFKMLYTGYWQPYPLKAIGYAIDNQGGYFIRQYSGSPVLMAGPVGSWDSTGVSEPLIIRDGTQYKMWYTGTGSGGTSAIGLATSSNLISWTKNSNPVLVKSVSGWDNGGVSSPSVNKDGTTYKMWYVGWSTISSVPKIGYATSTDGVIWTKRSTPVLSPTPGGNDKDGVTHPSVIKTGYADGKYLMAYTGVYSQFPMGFTTYLVLEAQSNDGITWTKIGVIVPVGVVNDFDDVSTSSSCLVYIPPPTLSYNVFYTGLDLFGSSANVHMRLGAAHGT
jgi:predicted GH43/DUF377 family glycosyl hydrolase